MIDNELSAEEMTLLHETYGDSEMDEVIRDVKNGDVVLHVGSTAVEIASDFIDDYQIIPNTNCFLQNYFDYAAFAHDMIQAGNLIECDSGVVELS